VIWVLRGWTLSPLTLYPDEIKPDPFAESAKGVLPSDAEVRIRLFLPPNLRTANKINSQQSYRINFNPRTHAVF